MFASSDPKVPRSAKTGTLCDGVTSTSDTAHNLSVTID